MLRGFFLSICLATPVWAADVPAPAPVTSAVVYAQGATLTRTARVDLPAGTHRLLVPLPLGAQMPRIALDGAMLTSAQRLPEAAEGRDYLSAAQAAALATFDEAEETAHLSEDARLRAAAALKAAEDRLGFLRSVGGEALATLDPDAITATAEAIGTATAAAEVDRADARAALRVAERAREDALRRQEQARRALAATGADLGPIALLAVGVEVAQAGPVDLTLTGFSPRAGWQPSYEAVLVGNAVRLIRKAEVQQNGDLPLVDVALTLSTANPFARTAPSPVPPNPARIGAPATRLQRSADMAELAPAAAPEPLMAEARVAAANFDGPVLSYDYPLPVTLPGGGGSTTITLGEVTLDARVFNGAAPRRDATAFLLAEVTNASGEILLPGPMEMFREDVRIGEAFLPMLAAGDETEIAFGPLHHLPLEFRLLDNETGDRGIFTTSGTRRQDMVFRVRNLSDTSETVETLFALPYSEQEALEITVTTLPAPDTRDVDEARGVAQWDLEVPPGGEAEVRIRIDLEWPEDQALNWRP